jgi:hypothetical protein
MERLQDVISTRIHSQVAEIDLSRIWAGVGPRLETVKRPWYETLRERWEEISPRWQTLAPLSAAAAVAGLVAMLFWQSQQGAVANTQWASNDNSAIVDSVQSNVQNVAFLREPETNTMVLWITDNASGSLP